MNYWLFKSEPETFSINDLMQKTHQMSPWDGVRNYQARNFMRQMNKDDLGFFYHSSCAVPGIVGIIKIIKTAYIEIPGLPWEMVDVQFVQKFPEIISLEKLRNISALKNMIILRKGNRLSITPVLKQEWETILKLLKKSE